jgi:IS4 transposase
MADYSKITDKTNEIVYNELFEKGMIFQERFSFWLGILDITDNGTIITLEGNRIKDMKLKKYTKEELTKFMKYSSIEGCWIDYQKTDEEIVRAWFVQKAEHDSIENRRDLKIDLLT